MLLRNKGVFAREEFKKKKVPSPGIKPESLTPSISSRSTGLPILILTLTKYLAVSRLVVGCWLLVTGWRLRIRFGRKSG